MKKLMFTLSMVFLVNAHGSEWERISKNIEEYQAQLEDSWFRSKDISLLLIEYVTKINIIFNAINENANIGKSFDVLVYKYMKKSKKDKIRFIAPETIFNDTDVPAYEHTQQSNFDLYYKKCGPEAFYITGYIEAIYLKTWLYKNYLSPIFEDWLKGNETLINDLTSREKLITKFLNDKIDIITRDVEIMKNVTMGHSRKFLKWIIQDYDYEKRQDSQYIYDCFNANKYIPHTSELEKILHSKIIELIQVYFVEKNTDKKCIVM